jgi:hypothetical protein
VGEVLVGQAQVGQIALAKSGTIGCVPDHRHGVLAGQQQRRAEPIGGVSAGAIDARGPAAGRRAVGHSGESFDSQAVITEGGLVIQPVLEPRRRDASGTIRSKTHRAEMMHRDGAVVERRLRRPAVLTPTDPVRRAIGAGQMPIQQITARHQRQTGQREAITAADRIEPVPFRWPAPQGRQHQDQAAAIAQHQQIGDEQEHAQIGAAPVDIGDHPLQRLRQGQVLQEGEHPGVGAQRITEDATRTGVLHPVAVVGIRLLGAGRQVDEASTGATRRIEQVPAVEAELQLLPQGAKGGVLPPGLQQRGAACRGLGLLLGRRERQPLVAGSVATPGGQALGAAVGYYQGWVTHGRQPTASMAPPVFQPPTAGWPGDPHDSGSPESLGDEQHLEVWWAAHLKPPGCQPDCWRNGSCRTVVCRPANMRACQGWNVGVTAGANL